MLNEDSNEEDKQKLTLSKNPAQYKNMNKNNSFSPVFPKGFKHTLFIRKLNKNELDRNIKFQSQLEKFFTSTNNFFDKNSPISINKKIKISDIDLFSRKYERKGTRFRTGRTQNTNEFKRKLTKKYASDVKNNKEELSMNNVDKYEFIDNDKLRFIFNSYKIINDNAYDLYNNYKTNTNSPDLKTLPNDISQSLSLQTKYLESRNIINKSNQKMAKYLMRRTNKNENDLLLNTIDSFRYRKEIINEIENNNQFKRNYGNLNLNWNMSLRRPEILKNGEKYKACININTNSNPFWAIIEETSNKENEVSIKPGFDLNNRQCTDFKKSVENTLVSNTPKNIKTIENLDKMNVTGKDLFDIEYNREMNIKKKKILHKTFLVDNGKIILDDDINTIFGDKTIYKSYDNQRTAFSVSNH